MSAKSFITGLIILASIPIGIFATQSTDRKEDLTNKGHRSAPISISLYIDGDVLYIYSQHRLDNLCVQIKDVAGNIQYADIVTIQPETEYRISLDALPQGEYQIQLTQGANYLTENFIK